MAFTPRLTVLMPVRDGERYLHAAVESILAQTFSDFEFLILDDGSTDSSGQIVRSFSDPRIRLIHNAEPVGVARTLNRGLDAARGDYVARMDCDDISLPRRFAAQVDYLDRHPDVGICGTWLQCVGEGRRSVWRYPSSPDIVRCFLLFDTALAHPTVMMRREFLEASGLRYDPRFSRAQDYDLWVRAARLFDMSSLPRVLLLYRRHSNQSVAVHAEDKLYFAGRVQSAQLEALGITPSAADLDLHAGAAPGSREFLERSCAWLCRIKEANDRRKIYPEPALSRVLGERWFRMCKASSGLGLWTWKLFRKAPFQGHVAWRRRARLAIKCGLRLAR